MLDRTIAFLESAYLHVEYRYVYINTLQKELITLAENNPGINVYTISLPFFKKKEFNTKQACCIDNFRQLCNNNQAAMLFIIVDSPL